MPELGIILVLSVDGCYHMVLRNKLEYTNFANVLVQIKHLPYLVLYKMCIEERQETKLTYGFFISYVVAFFIGLP